VEKNLGIRGVDRLSGKPTPPFGQLSLERSIFLGRDSLADLLCLEPWKEVLEMADDIVTK